MIVFGKPLSAYVRFTAAFLVLIAATGLIRLALSLAGVPNATTRWFSMSVVAWIALIYNAIRIHTTRFGTYRHLLVVCVLINVVAQSIASAGIGLAMATGTDNVFSAPEFAFGSDGKAWWHLLAHLFIGTTAGSLLPWLFGSLVLFVTKKISGERRIAAV